jgi:hypothetical protein
VALPSTLSPSRVAQHLRLRVSDLKDQLPKRQGATAAQRPPHSASPRFVEVPQQPVQPPGLGGLEVALHRPDGARRRMHSPDASLPLAAIIHSFLEAR